ncbi:hypothetical protein LSH36_825g03007 [Paralvinella palmiformis]|uniref:Uncharacterized protein n=1 Tax=Paralvinella palmiformis TaxID=53620 RepID=A0AAD9IZJ5_9ANNE|nr:hypothetical protein LSH36_825g03007 [Paralvinella palmiformis]
MIATKVLTAIFVLLLLTVRSLQQMVEGEQDSRWCEVDQYVISCPVVSVAGQNVSVNGRLYPCTRPIFIQFQVKKFNNSLASEYTFINEDETQRMMGWDQYMTFRVILKHNREYVFIKAGFVEESISVYFIETKIKLPKRTDCPKSGLSTNKVIPIVVVCVCSTLAAAAASALLLWWYKKRRALKLQASELLANMETSANSSPYQEEPISSEFDSQGPSTTTVIQNSVYRDSLNVDAALDPIPEEEAMECTAGGRMQRIHRRKLRNGTRSGRRDKRGNSSCNGYHQARDNADVQDSGREKFQVASPRHDGDDAVDVLICTSDVESTSAIPTIVDTSTSPKLNGEATNPVA